MTIAMITVGVGLLLIGLFACAVSTSKQRKPVGRSSTPPGSGGRKNQDLDNWWTPNPNTQEFYEWLWRE